MKIMIVYFSGTGNTELISKKIGEEFENKRHSVELVSLEDEYQLMNIDFSDKIIGFGFPVYKFTFPDLFLKYFKMINEKGQNNPCFLFSTYARFTAESFYEFAKRLDKKRFKLIAEKSFKSPSCGIAARKGEKDFEYESVMYFEDDIHLKIESFVKDIIYLSGKRNFSVKHSHNPLSTLRLKIVKDIERTKYPKLQIDTEVCSVCGLCAKKCPDNNLINRETHIEIADESHCLHCLRCMNHCQSNAIVFGKLSIGDNRYTLHKRNELYKKAASGYREKYWPDFEKIRIAWRKNTIKYWWSHRKNPEV